MKKQNGKPERYAVSDGSLVLELEAAPEGGFLVRSPVDSELLTEADTIHEAFEMPATPSSRSPGRARSS